VELFSSYYFCLGSPQTKQGFGLFKDDLSPISRQEMKLWVPLPCTESFLFLSVEDGDRPLQCLLSGGQFLPPRPRR